MKQICKGWRQLRCGGNCCYSAAMRLEHMALLGVDVIGDHEVTVSIPLGEAQVAAVERLAFACKDSGG